MIWLQHQFSVDNPELVRQQDFFQITGDVYRDPEGANRRTLRFDNNNKAYFLKLHWGVGWAEIFKNLLSLRWPVLGAKNEWLAIKKLHSINVDTMQLLAYGETGWNPARRKSFVVTAALENTISLEDYCADWLVTPPVAKHKRLLIRRVAQMTRQLHRHGINHRDLYICHFLLNQSWRGDEQDLHLALIDLHRVQIRHKTPPRWLIKDLGALWYSAMEIGLTQRDLLRFMREYSAGSLRETLLHEHAFWGQVKLRALALKAKPPPEAETNE